MQCHSSVTHSTSLVGFLGAQLEDSTLWGRIREDTIQESWGNSWGTGFSLMRDGKGQVLGTGAIGDLWSRSEGDISEAELKSRGNFRDTRRERRTLLNHLVGSPHQRPNKNIPAQLTRCSRTSSAANLNRQFPRDLTRRHIYRESTQPTP